MNSQNNFDAPELSTSVATHFNENTHDYTDFSFMPIDHVSNKLDRLLKETYWMHKLDTVHPNGLNAKLLYNI